MFNAEVCYGSGLIYDTSTATAQTKQEVDDFTADNDLPSYFLGVCQDFKHFGFAVSVIILNEDGTRIVRLARKPATSASPRQTKAAPSLTSSMPTGATRCRPPTSSASSC